MKIPKSFKIFASIITVDFDDLRLSNEDALGDCSYSQGRISVCKSYKGKYIPESTQIDTYYHEKIHVILDAMGEHELSRNEKFVEVFARLLRQSDETMEY